MSLVLLGLGIIITIYAILRFTAFKEKYTQPTQLFGISLSAEVVTLIFFALGLTMIVLFMVTEIQPLFYKGRDLQYNIRGY